jgi:hypothetical protein
MNETYGNAGRTRNFLRVVLALDGVVLVFALCAGTANNGGGIVLLLLAMAGITALALWYATKEGLWFVRKVEKTWAHTCAGLGGNFVGEQNDYLASVREGLRSRGQYYVATQKKAAYPLLINIRGNWEAWTAEVRFWQGQTIENYNRESAAFALSFGVPSVNFDLAASGLIRVRAGQVPIPEAYSHPGRVQASQRVLAAQVVSQAPDITKLPTQPLPMVPNVYAHAQQANGWAQELELLRAVPMARGFDGKTVYLPIEGQHWFIAAATGQGKSSWIWSLVLGLAPAWRVGLVKFIGLDQKMCELGIARHWFEHYADDDVSSVELLEQCVKAMHERLRAMQGVSRKFTPTVSTPLNIIVIDELGYLAAYMADKKLRDRADTAVRALLAKGRAPGFAIVGATQDARVEVCGYRDLYPIRIAGRIPATMIDKVLGDGAAEAGALCHLIPLPPNGAGVTYVLDETSMKPRLVRAAWCSDDDIQGMLAGVPVQPAPIQPALGAQAVKDEQPMQQLGFDSQPLKQW